MPNHIRNKLTILGISAQVEKVRETISNGKTEEGFTVTIDFNKIIPMPKELNIDDGSTGSLGQAIWYNEGEDISLLGEKEILKRFSKLSEKDKNEAIELGKKYHNNLKKFGHITWYYWRINNWDTKWNAYGFENEKRNTQNTIYFDTAWSPPIKVIETLSLMFPELEFKLEFADEDFGYNQGFIIMQNGIPINEYYPEKGSFEAKAFAFNIRYGDPTPELLNEYGYDENYNYIEE